MSGKHVEQNQPDTFEFSAANQKRIEEILKKYPKSFQWLFLLIIFFGLCFAIDVPDGYKFIRSIAEFSKDPNLSSYNLFGIEVRYYGYNNLWRLPPFLGWLPIWINEEIFFFRKICAKF